MREAVIVAGTRTGVGKAVRGNTAAARSDDMMATVVSELMRQTAGKLSPEDIEDVIVAAPCPRAAKG